MSCSEGLTRLLVFVVNFAFFGVGVALLVLGILNQVNYQRIDDVFPDGYDEIKYVAISAVVVGSVIVFISFLGCCGALRSSTCMLTSYGSILFIIFLIQVGLGIYALMKIKDTADFSKKLDNLLTKVMLGCTSKGSEDRCSVMADIQNVFQCCGVHNREEWILSGYTCPEKSTDGCLKVLNDWIKNSVSKLGIVAIAVSAVEVIGAILALCLSNCIRSHNRINSYH